MKRLLVVALMVLLVLALAGCGGESTGTTSAQPDQASTFEQIGYWKSEKLPSGAINRVFTIYTDETDEAKLIEYARSKMYTELGFTYVHFYNDEDKAPYISNPNLSFEHVMNLPEDGRILVYKKAPNGNESIYDGSMSKETKL